MRAERGKLWDDTPFDAHLLGQLADGGLCAPDAEGLFCEGTSWDLPVAGRCFFTPDQTGLSRLGIYNTQTDPIIVLFLRLIQKIALAACITSCGVASADDRAMTADGWKLVGISPAAEIFWIRASSISGPSIDRQVPLAIATPSKGVEVSIAHINCGELVFYRVLQDGRRTAPVNIANGSTWKSIAKVVCKENTSNSVSSRGTNAEKSVVETGSLGMKRYRSEIATNPWMSDAALFICKKLAAGSSLEAAGGDMAFAYSKELVKLWGLVPGDSMSTIDEQKSKESTKPILYIAMTKCPSLVSNAPLRER